MRNDVTLSLPEPVLRILDRLSRRGHQAYVVGGCVRDSLMGREPEDWDITTSALPQQTEAAFSDCRLIPVGLSHGTVGVLLEGEVYEITTFRVDGEYSDFRRPDSVSFTPSLREDLGRRDFTINALAYHPAQGLMDFFGGRKDLEARRIACVGDPSQRFQEDALRILRGARFASTLNFAIGEETARAMLAQRGLLQHVAWERIRVELDKSLLGNGFRRVFEGYASLLFQIIPELEDCQGFDQRSPYHHLDVWEHTLLAVDSAPAVLPVRLTLLLHDIAKPLCFHSDEEGRGHFYGHAQRGSELAWDILRRLRYDNATVHRVGELILHHDTEIPPRRNGVCRWLNRLGEDCLRQLFQVKQADHAAKAPGNGDKRAAALLEAERLMDEIVAEGQCFSLRDLAVNGGDLIRMGVPPGQELGRLLQDLLYQVMDGRLDNRREDLLEAVNHLRF